MLKKIKTMQLEFLIKIDTKNELNEFEAVQFMHDIKSRIEGYYVDPATMPPGEMRITPTDNTLTLFKQ